MTFADTNENLPKVGLFSMIIRKVKKMRKVAFWLTLLFCGSVISALAQTTDWEEYKNDKYEIKFPPKTKVLESETPDGWIMLDIHHTSTKLQLKFQKGQPTTEAEIRVGPKGSCLIIANVLKQTLKNQENALTSWFIQAQLY